MNKKTALVIDDDKELAQAFKVVLEMDDFEVTTLNDSQQAISEIKRLEPQIITLDVDMPYVSGIDILQDIQADESLNGMKVIMITASAQVNDHQSVIDRADLVLMKPVTLQQVRNFVTRISKTEP